MKDKEEILGENLKKARKFMGYTIEEASKMTKIPADYIRDFEYGIRDITYLQLYRLSVIYGWKMEELLGEEKPAFTETVLGDIRLKTEPHKINMNVFKKYVGESTKLF